VKQMTFSAAGFDCYAKTTRREIFLQEMDKALPWARLVALIEPALLCGACAGQGGPAPGWSGADVADVFPSARVQSFGPGGGGSAL